MLFTCTEASTFLDLTVTAPVNLEISFRQRQAVPQNQQIVFAQAFLPGPRAAGRPPRDWLLWEARRVGTVMVLETTGRGPKEREIQPVKVNLARLPGFGVAMPAGFKKLWFEPHGEASNEVKTDLAFPTDEPFTVRLGWHELVSEDTHGKLSAPLGWIFEVAGVGEPGERPLPAPPPPPPVDPPDLGQPRPLPGAEWDRSRLEGMVHSLLVSPWIAGGVASFRFPRGVVTWAREILAEIDQRPAA